MPHQTSESTVPAGYLIIKIFILILLFMSWKQSFWSPSASVLYLITHSSHLLIFR